MNRPSGRITPSPGRSPSPDAFQTLGEAIADALLLVDPDQRIVVFNTAAERMFGFDRDQVIGEPLNTLLPHHIHAAHDRHIRRFGLQGAGHHISGLDRTRVTGRRSDGTDFPAEVSLAVIEINGELMASAVVRDITSRVETERALAESEELFRVAFQHSPLAMALIDMNGRCISANDALADMTGITLADLEGKPMTDLVVPDDLPIVEAGINRLLTDGATVDLEFRQWGPNHTHRTVEAHLALVVDDQGNPTCAIGQSMDVTERVESRKAIQEMRESRHDLIASVSHELRTPLTAVVGFAELLRDRYPTLVDTERDEMVRAIAKESADLTNLVDDLIVAAKAETKELAVVRVPVDLQAQTRQVLEAWGSADTGRIEIVGPQARGLGDPGRIRQILRNLISNAIRYGGERIVVHVNQDQTTARIAVGDNGTPIPLEDQERIFLPYQRAHRTPGVTAPIGFGLAVSRQLAELMDGSLTLHRTGDENLFELALPAINET